MQPPTFSLSDFGLEEIPENAKSYRFAVYAGTGDLLHDGFFYTEDDVSPQDAAAEIGARDDYRDQSRLTVLTWTSMFPAGNDGLASLLQVPPTLGEAGGEAGRYER